MANNETTNPDYLLDDDYDAFMEEEFRKSDQRELERKAQKQASANNVNIHQPQNQDNIDPTIGKPAEKLPIDYKTLGCVDIDIAKNNYIVLANSFIKSCVVAPTLDARKLFYLAVSEIKKDDDDLKPIHTHARDLMDMGIFKEKNVNRIYTRANKATNDLLKNSFIYLKEDENKWTGFPLTSYVEYDNGDIYIVLNPILKPFFLHLQKDFTETLFNFLLKMPTQDSMVLYNYLFMLYSKYTFKRDKNGVATFVIPNEEIEALFEGEYYANKNKKNVSKRYLNRKDFNAHLLKPAINAINKSGLLNVEMKNVRNSKHEIASYIFKVSIGDVYVTLKEERDQQIQERLEEKELKNINLFFYKRFGIKSYNKDAKTEEEGTIEKLREKGVSLVQLKLAAIQMQAYLNSTSDCIWEQKAYENNTIEAKTALRNPYGVLETIITKNRYAKKITQFDKATDYAELERKGIHISQLSKFNGADYDLDLVKAYEESDAVASDINLLFENVLETLDTVPNPFWDGIRKEAL